MNELTSTEFRKHYARLTEPTLVTVNGHQIGYWVPGSISNTEAALRTFDPPGGREAQASAQAQRDELLRKINRGRSV